MSISELVEGVQFTLDQNGHVTAVVVDPALWRRILDALEDAEDRALIRSLRARLLQGPEAANARRWQDIEGQWQ